MAPHTDSVEWTRREGTHPSLVAFAFAAAGEDKTSHVSCGRHWDRASAFTVWPHTWAEYDGKSTSSVAPDK